MYFFLIFLLYVIREWEPIDACDALELLSPSFTHSFVRRYAVSRLHCTTYANIFLYLPQLVQALRYETKASVNDILFVTKDMTDVATANVIFVLKNTIILLSLYIDFTQCLKAWEIYDFIFIFKNIY